MEIECFPTLSKEQIDNALLVEGGVETKFGGGLVKKPTRLVFGGGAPFRISGIDMPVDQIAIQTAKEWFRSNLS